MVIHLKYGISSTASKSDLYSTRVINFNQRLIPFFQYQEHHLPLTLKEQVNKNVALFYKLIYTSFCQTL